MYLLFQITALTVLLLVAQEALRRANRWAVWGVFFLAPLILTPYWMQVNDLGLFSWFKYYTVFFCVCWGTALRFTSLGHRAWARSTIPLLLAMNILEAVVVDVFGHGWAHSLNAAAGLLLIATMAYGPNSMRIRSASGCTDLHYETGKGWVIGYTLWNWMFVYLNYRALAGHHIAVLAAGLIVALSEPRRWGQTRASTLGVSLLFTATSYSGMIAWMDTSNWFNERVGLVAAAVALAFIVLSTLHSVCARQTAAGLLTQAGPRGQNHRAGDSSRRLDLSVESAASIPYSGKACHVSFRPCRRFDPACCRPG